MDVLKLKIEQRDESNRGHGPPASWFMAICIHILSPNLETQTLASLHFRDLDDLHKEGLSVRKP